MVNGMLDSYLMNLRKEIDRLLRENGRAEPDIVQVLVADDGLRPNQSAEFLEEDGRTALQFRCGVSEEQMRNEFEFRRKAAALLGVNAVIENRTVTSKPLEGETVFIRHGHEEED